MRTIWVVVALTLVVAATLVFWPGRPAELSHSLHLKAYFADAQGVLPGAEVRVAGVVVGKVTQVRVRTDLQQNPAEVLMLLQTPYDLRLPADALVVVEAAGIFGATFLEINIKGTTGQPVEDNATLRTIPNSSLSAEQILNCLSSLADHKPCNLSRAKSAPTDVEIKR